MYNIGIINYGAGNIASVMKSVDYAGGASQIVSTPEEIMKCDKIILPGVGAAGLAIKKLREKSLESVLKEAVFEKGKHLMGICVGMQILAKDLYEFGHHKGLNWIPGEVIPIEEYGIANKPVPNMGWRDVEFSNEMKDLSKRLGRHKTFYFAHSFTLVTDKNIVCCTSNYEKKFVAGIAYNNICAFQFHPEKSQLSGDVLMQWFLNWEP